MSDVRFGIIGCGNIARAHLPSLIYGKGITCTGLYDRIPEHAEKLNEEFGGEHKYSEITNMHKALQIILNAEEGVTHE